MTFMFGISTDVGSTTHTSRLIGPLVRWLFPGVSDATVSRVQTIVRKTAHVTEYALLALLLWRARRRPTRGDLRPWLWTEAGFAWTVAVVFAISDEVHQSFVPSRQGQVSDVLFDATGAAVGLLLLRAFGRWRGKW
jgi:VanZ family protein